MSLLIAGDFTGACCEACYTAWITRLEGMHMSEEEWPPYLYQSNSEFEDFFRGN